MHDVADVETEDPVVCAEILHSQGASGSDLVPLLDLKFVHLLKGLE